MLVYWKCLSQHISSVLFSRNMKSKRFLLPRGGRRSRQVKRYQKEKKNLGEKKISLAGDDWIRTSDPRSQQSTAEPRQTESGHDVTNCIGNKPPGCGPGANSTAF